MCSTAQTPKKTSVHQVQPHKGKLRNTLSKRVQQFSSTAGGETVRGGSRIAIYGLYLCSTRLVLVWLREEPATKNTFMDNY